MNYIKGVSSDNDLINLAHLLGIHLDGVKTIDEINDNDVSKSLLILLRIDTGVGHWVCIDKGYYFDPMGIGPDTVLKVKGYNAKQYQGTYNTYCGIWCILWLYSRQKSSPDIMNDFHDLNNRDFEI